VIQTVLTYWLKTGAQIWKRGYGFDKLAAFVEIGVKDTDNVKRATADLGVTYHGLNVPAYIMSPANPPALWDIAPSADNSIVGGHAVAACGYDASGLSFISWGMKFKMTWGFYGQFVDESYGICDRDWISAKGVAPCGFTLSQLEDAMQPLKAS
jgi:hypothetical protein